MVYLGWCGLLLPAHGRARSLDRGGDLVHIGSDGRGGGGALEYSVTPLEAEDSESSTESRRLKPGATAEEQLLPQSGSSITPHPLRTTIIKKVTFVQESQTTNIP